MVVVVQYIITKCVWIIRNCVCSAKHNSKWFQLNDERVAESTIEALEKECFGNGVSNTNSYMLVNRAKDVGGEDVLEDSDADARTTEDLGAPTEFDFDASNEANGGVVLDYERSDHQLYEDLLADLEDVPLPTCRWVDGGDHGDHDDDGDVDADDGDDDDDDDE